MPPRSVPAPAPTPAPAPAQEPVLEEFIPHVVESAMFFRQWAEEQKTIEPEVIGTFQFYATQQNWIADTPSGWASKFARWVQSGG